MKIVFMGTSDISVPTLEKLYNNNIEIPYVITAIDKKAARNKKIVVSPVKQKAEEMGLQILQPEKIKKDEETLQKIKNIFPDFIVLVSYGQILPKEILDIPKFACLNGHPSKLPLYRGPSPIQTTLLNGDKKTATTVMKMDMGLDTGDILKQVDVDINQDDNAITLFEKMGQLTADIIYETIINFQNIKPCVQDNNKATYSKIIKKEDAFIDFEKENANNILYKIKAYCIWPIAYFYYDNEIYKIHKAKVSAEDMINRSKNKKEIFDKKFIIADGKLFAKCKGNTFLEILEIQKQGKNKLNTKDFINGIK